jgi:scyllo-inositol 2-dehydrogenase (NADP+)
MDDLVATDIDVVVIASPTHLHFEQALMALRAKKHVVVDKPMCVSQKEACQLLQVANEMQVILTVFQNRRWDSDFITVQRLVAEKALGDLTYVEIHFDRYRPELKNNWKESRDMPGSGLLYDLGSHLVDQMIVLFGHPRSVEGIYHLTMK